MHKGRQEEFGSQFQARTGTRAPPLKRREEVQKTGTEGEKISPVAGVFDQHQFSVVNKNARDFSKKADSLIVTAQLVRRKDGEGRVE
jgi:hypothetical protein